MTNSEALIKKANIQQIAEQGAKIYDEIKINFEPKENGKFLAIDVETRDPFLGSTSSEAVELARKAHSDTVFYVVKIGHSVAETLAGMGLSGL